MDWLIIWISRKFNRFFLGVWCTKCSGDVLWDEVEKKWWCYKCGEYESYYFFDKENNILA